MQNVFPGVPIISRSRVVIPDNDGDLLTFGNVDSGGRGVWAISFVPDQQWQGSFVLLGRPFGKDASTAQVGYVPFCYRPGAMLNGAAADYGVAQGMRFDTIVARSDIKVPLMGDELAFMVTCSQGTCTIYSRPLDGSASAV